MADKSIFELDLQTTFATNDRLVVGNYANSDAEAITGQTLVNLLATMLDGHGGIQSIAKTGSSGTDPVVDVYTITLADQTTTTFSVTNGLKGDTGDQTFVYFRWAHTQPSSWSDTTDQPDEWMGVYAGTATTPPTTVSAYSWVRVRGDKGDTGDASAITTQNVSYQESSSGTVAPSGSWTTTIPTVTPGNFLWTRTQLAFNDGTTVTAYSVSRYGIDGSGAVSSVNNVSPDSNGNVALTGTDIPMSDNQSIQTHVTDAEDDIAELKTSFNWLSGKTVYIFGDSLSAIPNNPWVYIQQLVPSAVIHNEAINGSSFATIASTISSTSISDADVIFILGGTNDWQGGVALNTTETNIESCLTNIYAKIKTAQIVLIAPPYSLMSANEEKNTIGYGISAYVEAIKYKASKYKIPCVDLFHTSACNSTTVTTMMDDSGSGKRIHPNAYLAKNMAECIITLATSDKHEIVPIPLTRNPSFLPDDTYIAEFDPRSKVMWLPIMHFSADTTLGNTLLYYTNLDLLGLTALSSTLIDAVSDSAPTHYVQMIYIPPGGGVINAWTGALAGRVAYSQPLTIH